MSLRYYIINIAAIPDVLIPVRGEIPIATEIDTAQYTGSISWSPADNPFSAETVYTANIVLTAKAGFTLNGVTENFFTVAGAATTNAADSVNVTAVFPETGAVPDIEVLFMSASETGGTSGTVESISVTLTFNADPATLTIDNITVTGATKVLLTGSGTSRNLAISNINVANEGMITISITSPDGYSITGTTQTAVIYRITTSNMTISMDYRGGKLVYILQSADPGHDANVPHGLIAAEFDSDLSGEPWALPSYYTTAVPGGTDTDRGTGLSNTDNIISQNDPDYIPVAVSLIRATFNERLMKQPCKM